MKLVNLLLISLLFCLVLVSAAPPFTTSGDSALTVEPVIIETLKANENYKFQVHVFNTSNGAPINYNTSCYVHVYNVSGNHIYAAENTSIDNRFDYEFLILGDKLPVGIYQVKFQCNNTNGRGGAAEFEFAATPSGRAPNSFFDNPLILIMGIVGGALLILGVSRHNPMFGFLSSVVFLMLGVYIMIYGLDNVTDLYTQTVAITLIGMGVVMMISAAYEWLYELGEDEE